MRVHPIDPFFDTRYLIDQSNRCGPSPHHPFFVVRRHPAEPHSRTKPNACFHRTQRMDMRAHTRTRTAASCICYKIMPCRFLVLATRRRCWPAPKSFGSIATVLSLQCTHNSIWSTPAASSSSSFLACSTHLIISVDCEVVGVGSIDLSLRDRAGQGSARAKRVHQSATYIQVLVHLLEQLRRLLVVHALPLQQPPPCICLVRFMVEMVRRPNRHAPHYVLA